MPHAPAAAQHAAPAIVLCTLNARYIHASLGLRYLLANMGELTPQTVLREFTIARPSQEIVDELLLTLGEPLPGAVQSHRLWRRTVWNVTRTS